LQEKAADVSPKQAISIMGFYIVGFCGMQEIFFKIK